MFRFPLLVLKGIDFSKTAGNMLGNLKQVEVWSLGSSLARCSSAEVLAHLGILLLLWEFEYLTPKVGFLAGQKGALVPSRLGHLRAELRKNLPGPVSGEHWVRLINSQRPP